MLLPHQRPMIFVFSEDIILIKKAIFVLPLLFASAIPALAQQSDGPLGDRAGKYVGSGEGDLTAEFTHIQDDIYAVSLGTIVPISDAGAGCAGGIDGEMIMTKRGGNFFVENEDYDAALGDNPVNAPLCEIGISFAGGVLSIEEREGCMPYHGASCSFTGELVQETAAN